MPGARPKPYFLNRCFKGDCFVPLRPSGLSQRRATDDILLPQAGCFPGCSILLLPRQFRALCSLPAKQTYPRSNGRTGGESARKAAVSAFSTFSIIRTVNAMEAYTAKAHANLFPHSPNGYVLNLFPGLCYLPLFPRP